MNYLDNEKFDNGRGVADLYVRYGFYSDEEAEAFKNELKDESKRNGKYISVFNDATEALANAIDSKALRNACDSIDLDENRSDFLVNAWSDTDCAFNKDTINYVRRDAYRLLAVASNTLSSRFESIGKKNLETIVDRINPDMIADAYEEKEAEKKDTDDNCSINIITTSQGMERIKQFLSENGEVEFIEEDK